MGKSTVTELRKLSYAILDAEYRSFIVKRTLQRLDSGEITIEEAVSILRERPVTENVDDRVI